MAHSRPPSHVSFPKGKPEKPVYSRECISELLFGLFDIYSRLPSCLNVIRLEMIQMVCEKNDALSQDSETPDELNEDAQILLQEVLQLREGADQIGKKMNTVIKLMSTALNEGIKLVLRSVEHFQTPEISNAELRSWISQSRESITEQLLRDIQPILDSVRDLIQFRIGDDLSVEVES